MRGTGLKPGASGLRLVALTGSLLALLSCSSRGNGVNLALLADPPEVTIGERLFLETRFAQFFAANFNGDVTAPLPAGDPTMDETVTPDGGLPGPFAGLTMNCRGCHLVDEQFEEADGGMRTYGDFAPRSPVPDRGDGLTVTARNSPPLVNATLPRTVDFFLHFDGEFASIEDLIRGTLTGRNFGWLATEEALALAHIALVIRNDSGTDALGRDFGGWSYAELFRGTNPNLPPSLQLPPAFRLEVTTATDQEILDAVAALIGAYVDGLRFSQATDPDGEYNASPYDVFLAKNGLPRKPDPGESDLDYARRLRGLVGALGSPNYVAHDGSFGTHDQLFTFGPQELFGLKVFLREAAAPLDPNVGNCLLCHAPPNFTDFRFHNTGVAQEEFDGLHGAGAFMALSIPDLTTRDGNPEAYLPPSAARPAGTGIFRAAPSMADPVATDLGMWNIFANDDIPTPQSTLQDFLCEEFGVQAGSCADDDLLPFSIAYFKTPALRDLGHAGPYMHNGRFGSLADTVEHYRTNSDLMRLGQLRNGSDELAEITLTDQDRDALVKFLRALNEDYE